jgi:hypothetical protein
VEFCLLEEARRKIFVAEVKIACFFFFVVGIKILNSPWEESCRNSQILGVSSKKTSVCKKWVKLRRASSTRI